MALQNYSIESMKGFLNKVYHIPAYQREYSWEQVELEDFWNDLKSVYNGKEEMHFFGQIVVHHNEPDGKRFIIDGQQRTITSMIFLRVLQIQFEKLRQDNYTEANKRIFEIAACLGYYDEEEKNPHLILSPEYQSYYTDKILL